MQILRLGLVISLAILTGACSSAPQNVAPSHTLVTSTTTQNKSAEPTKAQAKAKSDLPTWYITPPENTATGCAKIRGNDLNTARIIARAKAQAQYLETQQVSVNAETHITETASSKTGSQSTYNNKITLKTSGELNHQYGVKKHKMLEINNATHLCVLYGVISY